MQKAKHPNKKFKQNHKLTPEVHARPSESTYTARGKPWLMGKQARKQRRPRKTKTKQKTKH